MGISSIKRVSETASLGLWKMTETWEELLPLVRLGEQDLAPLNALTKPKRKQEWLACRILFQEMTGTVPLIQHNADRKPSAVHYSGDISFSHSGDFAAVYIDETKPVGVDIQQMKPSISKGLDYFLNEKEQEWIDAKNNVQMHLVWSAKEAAFKYISSAELDFRNHCTVKSLTVNAAGHFEIAVNRPEGEEKICIAYEIFEDYVFTWTT